MPLNKKMAIRLAKICLWVYDFDDTREAELLSFGEESPILETQVTDGARNPTSSVGIVEYQNLVIVAFQGTITEFGRDGVFRFDSLMDWIQNFRIKLLATNSTGLPGLVHEGFYEQLDLVYDQVKLALPAENKPIIVTGHSQGGAIATLATKRLKNDGFPVRESYTFAAPRAADAVFARSIRTPFHRVEFGHDIVPHVPPLLTHRGVLGTELSALGRFFDLPEILVALHDLTKRLKKNSYQGVGRLTYRGDRGKLMRDLTAAQEKSLFHPRKRQLLLAGKRLVRHHGLDHYIGMFS